MTEQNGPQYQPPPQQQGWIHQQVPPPPPPEPPKKKHGFRNIVIACAVLLGVVVVANLPDSDSPSASMVATDAPVAKAPDPEPVESSPAVVEDEPADTSIEDERGFLTYQQIKSAFKQSGFDIIVFHSSKRDGGCFDGAGSSDASIAFVVFKCQYEAMPVVLPEFEESIAEKTDIQYKVRDANWVVYFSQELSADEFASGYPGAEVEVI